MMKSKQDQQGVVLAVCLIILLVITLIGTAAVQGTGLELKMAKNTEERQQVFQLAEAALRRAEATLDGAGYTKTDLSTATCTNPATCFDPTCTGGLCFMGDFSSSDPTLCQVYSGAVPTVPVWFDPALDVWNTASRHQTVDITGTEVKYIIEFQCFVDSWRGDVASDLGDALFRITVLGENDNGNIQVMLQSTYGLQYN